MQETQVKLGSCHAALMQVDHEKWEDACVDNTVWELVDLIKPSI